VGEHQKWRGEGGERDAGKVASGAISPHPPVSHGTGESSARGAAEPASQEVVTSAVATGNAKRRGENFHQREGEKLSAVKVSDQPPDAWRVPESEISQVLTYVACGYSLRQAAAAVGRSHTTFVKLQRRDPKFACRLLQHRELARDKPLRQVLQASERSWRAAAWLLKYLDAQERAPHAKRRARRRVAAEAMSQLGHAGTLDVTLQPTNGDVGDAK
jgi:hypothetical protein